MFIEHYDLEVFTPPCKPGSERYTAKAHLETDITPNSDPSEFYVAWRTLQSCSASINVEEGWPHYRLSSQRNRCQQSSGS